MSGPKTSYISIEEQIRMQLTAADKTITAAFSRAQTELDKAEDRIESLVRSLRICSESQLADRVFEQTSVAIRVAHPHSSQTCAHSVQHLRRVR